MRLAACAAARCTARLERQPRRTVEYPLEQRRSVPLRQHERQLAAALAFAGDRPQPYAVYVDDTDAVWVNDWGANAILSFDPKTREVRILSSTRQLRQCAAACWSQRRLGAESAVCGAVKETSPERCQSLVLAPRPTVPLD